MPITQIAFAAGFASVRQFNDTIREVFASSPTELRGTRQPCAAGGTLSLRLPYRAPFHAESIFGFLGDRAVPGVEAWDGTTYRRSLRLQPRQRGDRGLAGPELAGCERADVHAASRQRRRRSGRGAAMPADVRPRRRSEHHRDAFRRRPDPRPARSQASRPSLARTSRRRRVADEGGARSAGLGQGARTLGDATGRGRRPTAGRARRRCHPRVPVGCRRSRVARRADFAMPTARRPSVDPRRASRLLQATS